MSRQLGVIVALAALVGIAEGKPQTAATKPKAPATGKAKAAKAVPPPADADLGSAAGPADGSAAEVPPTPEEIEASLPPHINGPKLVDLGDNVEIDVPEGMILLEQREAVDMLQKGGSSADNVRAIVGKIGADWLLVIEYADVGYVTDTDADKLDANALFKDYVDGTNQQNEKRRTLGVPELVLDGWSEPPNYKKDIHHLIWGLKGHSTDGPIVNYFTRILGRNGYLSVNLIDAPETLEKSKVEAGAAMTATRFKQGYRYEDHVKSDKSSGYGLRALVIGGTGLAVLKVAKAGFLIKLLLVFKKAFIVIFAAIGGFFKWLFGRKKKDDLVVPPSDPTPPTDSTV